MAHINPFGELQISKATTAVPRKIFGRHFFHNSYLRSFVNFYPSDILQADNFYVYMTFEYKI